MTPEILDYIKSQRVGVLAVEMLDGSPHAATVHFAHSEQPLLFYFETYRHYRKAEPISANEKTRASFVIGTSETEQKTLQLDGIIEKLKPEESENYDSIYFGKFSEKKGKYDPAKTLIFKFTPTWWRFTDWKTPKGKVIITSE